MTASSAAHALAALGTTRHDVLLSDLGMPHMDGFELIGHIRRSADPAIRTIPAAALTAYARSEDRARALRSGFQIHLSKPIDPAAVVNARAMPLLVRELLAQDWTSEVTSIRTNWLALADVTAMGWLPVAEIPRGGALL